MSQNLLVTFTSSAQFGIFGAIVLIIFGWVDKKDRFTDIGRFLFMALGIYALWVILTGQIHVPEVAVGEISKEMRIISFFKGLVLCGGISLLSYVLKLMHVRYYRLVTILCMALALFLFFTVNNIQQA